MINDLKATAKKVIKNKKAFLQEIQKPSHNTEQSNIQKLLEQKERRLKEIIGLRKSLYEDWKKGDITKEEFDSICSEYSKEKEQINCKIESLQNELKANNQVRDEKHFLELLEQLVDFKQVPKQILVSLIEKIEIFQDRTVKIHYKFSKP